MCFWNMRHKNILLILITMSFLSLLKVLVKNISELSFEDEGLTKIKNLGSETWLPITTIQIGNYGSDNGFQGHLNNHYFLLKKNNDKQYSWRVELSDLVITEKKWTAPLKIKKTNIEVSFGHFDEKIINILNKQK